MSLDPANESPPARRRLKLRDQMVLVAAIALMLGLGLHHARVNRRVERFQARLMAWDGQIRTADPSLDFDHLSFQCWISWEGNRCRYRAGYRTAAGRTISVEAAIHPGLFGGAGRVEASSGGRSVSWPIEEFERGRRVDFRAEFPEAFR